MNKSTLKNFAVNARLELLARVKDRAALYGITEEKVKTHDLARSDQFQKLGGDMLTAREIKQRNALISRVSARGFGQAMEEAAYTWFNRFIALRYMQAHNLLPVDVPVLPMAAGELPQIVRQAQNVTLEGVDIALVADMLDNNRTEELYKYLLIALCNALSEPLPQMFEAIADYTELLFPDGILKAESVLGMLAGVEADNWQDIQVIGWLYQYYNTELKQETFDLLKKNVKITKDRIGAATQLFTPEWIVNYMVENSLGRMWLEGHPDKNLRMKWRYYMDEAEQTPEVAAQLAELRKGYADRQPETITVLDPCMGSGHILVYAFDVLMDIYRSRGYTDRDAVQSIVTNNLYGLDIDDRAAQLAYFAVMMKACEYDRRFLRRGIQPQVCAIQESPAIDVHGLDSFGPDAPLAKKLYTTFIDAKEYGSIIHVDLTGDELRRLSHSIIAMSAATTGESIANIGDSKHAAGIIALLVKQATIMAWKYDVVVTNPPYMGASGMGEKLSKFVKDNYPNSKSDLFAVFIEKGNGWVKLNGYNCMVTMQSWMFLSSFEKLRKSIIENKTIACLMHMENMVLGIAFGTAVTVFRNMTLADYKGVYNHIRLGDIENDQPKQFPVPGNRFAQISADNFANIPGMPMAYWASTNMVNMFSNDKIGDYSVVKSGMQTGNNDLFLRYWFEVYYSRIGFSMSNHNEFKENGYKWAPQTKGGLYRKWYGNYEYIVNFENDCYEIGRYKGTVRIRDINQYFIRGITWTHTTAGGFGGRLLPEGFTFNVESPSLFANNMSLYFILGKAAQSCLWLLNSVFHYHAEDILNLPIRYSKETQVESIVHDNITISKIDWDSFETSWDFQCHPLI